MFQFSKSLLWTVWKYADEFYRDDMNCADYDTWKRSLDEPYHIIHDITRVDWWDSCPYFQYAIGRLEYEAFALEQDRQYAVRSANNRNPEYGVLRHA